MDYLARDGAPISEGLWNKIDNVIVEHAKKHMVCRRFLNIYGPLGAGASTVNIDSFAKDEVLENGFGRIAGRNTVELPQLYQDFSLLWRDLEEAEKNGYSVDLSSAMTAAQRFAKQEDELILFGNKSLGIKGLMDATGAKKIKRGDWSKGEDAYTNVAQGLAYLSGNDMLGRYALVLSPEVYLSLQRLQPNVGLLEIDRISKLVDGRVYPVGTYGAGKAVLVCAEPQYMDLAIGVDLEAGYLEQRDLNHYFRLLETIALRLKEPKAVVTFE